ncbi:tetratricopeptide repeat protein [Prevotella sp. P6B4]|uniref:tetratricopeptide repeat protein n=1 Tax=Prevotella sp. P6B4 TaxID=1410614 RepID=UPI00048DCAD2|nr:tetratricopeptide repeat protein [Prevotella sp. P6B4]
MDRITELIQHPERMDRDSLYELRSLLALYPYFQTARLLLLQNLYLLHDATFDEELRRASAYITNRRVLFQMIEGRHYEYHPVAATAKAKPVAAPEPAVDRTISLIDNFLESIPKESDDEPTRKSKRRPTPADAAVDYVAYLMDIEPDGGQEMPGEVPQMPGQELIDSFINDDNGGFQLREVPEYHPEPAPEPQNDENEVESEYFTETLARIYIKQGRYSKALEIIQRLSLQIPKKNAYFADQIRFLEKLIVNSNKKNK